MKQNKYGVYITRDRVDENGWMSMSSSLVTIGNGAMSAFNSALGVPSLVYIPKNEGYGMSSFSKPLFMNIAKGNSSYRGKTGFIHAVYGDDAFQPAEGYDTLYAADYIGCKSFTVALSDEEAHKRPSKEYRLTENGYEEFRVNEFLTNSTKTTYEFERSDVCAVIDGLMSGKKTVVVGEASRALAAMVNALKALPSASGANTISFNTAATRPEATGFSRLSLGSYLEPEAISNLNVDEYYVVDVNNVYERYEFDSSAARIVYDDGSCESLVPDCPESAANCDEYISGWESAARRRELFVLANTYFEAAACANISQEELERYLKLYEASINDLRRDKYEALKETVEPALKTLAQSTLFGKKYSMLNDAQIATLGRFIEEVPRPVSGAASGIADSCAPERLGRFIKMCYGYVEAKGTSSIGAVNWLFELFRLETPDAQTAINKFISELDRDKLLRLVGLLDENSDLFTASPPYKSGELLKAKVLMRYASESDRRTAYARLHTPASQGTDWLLAEAYKSIANEDDLERWLNLDKTLSVVSHNVLVNSFKTAFKKFLASHPVTEHNYEAYRAAAGKFSYDEASFQKEIARLEKRADNIKLFEERLEENLRSRKAFVDNERGFLSHEVENDNDVEKVLYGSMYKRSRTFGGEYYIWWLAAFLISVLSAGCAVIIKNVLNIPWTEFFSTLREPIEGVPIDAILTFVPFALAISVGLLVFLFVKDKRSSNGRRLMWSALSTLCVVIIPYLVFLLICGMMYYLV